MVKTLYHGEVDIEYWEYMLAGVYLFVLVLHFARRKNMAIKKAPEYKYLLWGLYAKLFGGLFFSLIYFYYYEGGDTISYFYSAVSMAKLARKDFMDYLVVLFGEASVQNRSYFDMETGWPLGYVYYDPRTFFVIRAISPLVIITFNSYLITTVVLASLSYAGIWRCFRTFVGYFPTITGKLAIAFLFMPSAIFWGSAILKDTFTFSATCWWVHCLDELVFKRRHPLSNTFGLFLAFTIIIVVKPYIVMVLLPVSLLWVFHARIAALRNLLVKFVLLPIGFIGLAAASYYTLEWLGDRLDKFALDRALKTIQITQGDLSRAEQYGANYFDIGELDGTWGGVISKFPIATNAALFRPYLWESGSPVMVLSALENLWLLMLAVGVLLRTRVLFLFRAWLGNPLVFLSMTFAVFFAFVIGVTTPNFGALVRFKIPLIPFFVAGLYIIGLLNERRRAALRKGRSFTLKEYRRGDPVGQVVMVEQGRSKQRVNRRG